jgi:pimeloyl-ACP methyl ester carboxylesterase
MSNQVKLIQNYFKFISVIAPSYAANQGVKVFSKVRLKGIKTKEVEFFTLSKAFNVPFKDHKPLQCYEMGNPEGKLIFLIHGWDSNIGSLTLFAKALMETNNYRIIGVSLPAHGYHDEKRTNMVESGKAFKSVLNFINPQEPFDVISHSFGSGVTTMMLADSDFKADRIVFLTTPNKIKNIFDEFKTFIKMGDKAYEKLLEIAKNKILNESIENYTIAKKLTKANYNKLLIIHDEFDKILPFKNSKEIIEKHPNIKLHKMQKIGHYRMLWNPEVVEIAKQFLISEN